jgi:hypothetical protein
MKKPIDILIEAINMIEDKKLRALILRAFMQYNDELIEMSKNIEKILKK